MSVMFMLDTYVCVCVHTCVCMYVCIYIYIYIHKVYTGNHGAQRRALREVVVGPRLSRRG